MTAALERLNHWITVVPSRINEMSEVDLSFRPQPNKWSKKEVFGHLCDSAHTNLQRFVRAQYEPQPYKVIKYAQNHWIERMDYQNLPLDHIVNTWVNLNKQLKVVIGKMSKESLDILCDNGDDNIVTLGWLITDYMDHMEHHLKQIFSDL